MGGVWAFTHLIFCFSLFSPYLCVNDGTLWPIQSQTESNTQYTSLLDSRFDE
jgi:hypothetical protein